MIAARLGFAVALVCASSCQEGEFVDFDGPESDCPAARARGDGTCCPAWTEADAGRCVLRAWSRAEESTGMPGAHGLSLGVDAGGRGLLAWTVASEGESTVVIAEEIAAGRLEPREPSPATSLGGAATMPTVATSRDDDRAAVVWTQDADAEGRIVASLRGAMGGWGDPYTGAALSWGGRARAPEVALGPGEELLVAWIQRIGADERVVVRRWQGDEEHASVIVSPPATVTGGPRLAVADNGDALVGWAQTAETAPAVVLASERTRGEGELTRPVIADALSVPSGLVTIGHGPVVAMDRRGGAALAWTQADATGHEALYLATRDGLGNWTAPQSSADAFSRPDTVVRSVSVAFGPSGELWVAWSETTGTGHRVAAAVRDAEGDWIEDGRDPAVLSPEGADAIQPVLAVGPSGEAVVAFAERGADGRRVVARRRHAGGTRWLDPEVLSDDAHGDASAPAVAIGPSGRTIAAWVQGRPHEGTVRIAWVD